jgi:8-oxo-dGTP diphosphatase
MRDRSVTIAKPTARATTLAVDVVLLTPGRDELSVLLVKSVDSRGRERWMLPWDGPGGDDESLDDAALRVARGANGASPAFLDQVASYGDNRRHPGDASVSVAYVALVPLGAPSPDSGEVAWFPLSQLPSLMPRQRAIVDGAASAVRVRVDQQPLAFRLLPGTFTLSDLQAIYELLLGRRLHKASFRRALQAAYLVEPTEEWRSEGPGRPAQLFRYAPRRRRGSRRGVRFDLFSD